MRAVVVINFMISGGRATAECFTAEKRRAGFAFIYRADSIGGRGTRPPLMITRTLVETSEADKIHAASVRIATNETRLTAA